MFRLLSANQINPAGPARFCGKTNKSQQLDEIEQSYPEANILGEKSAGSVSLKFAD
jgi:hypothetical protein